MKEDLKLLEAFYLAIQDAYKDGLPLHLADEEKSAMKVLTETEFEKKTVEEIQELLRRKHILITDIRRPALDFDSIGLSTLGPLSMVTDIQGMSIPIRHGLYTNAKDS